MSKENRKRMYDQLVKAGRYKDIDQALIDEFGEVPAKPSTPTKSKQDTSSKKKGGK